ncbi:LysR family transcriptional regulator [Rhizobium leguminosarum]|uniref:Transcriptional regulator, LysR family n=1 Tax=Rhizobium leguminosarum bv. trifolii (strain WSM1325) TaxID=395491 RepID=C6AXF8_RHILS|nr:LysR family transcriptional regulator [Rhizobium leguminosarum]ACS58082.1 transcriptional regulator, LysR family [Rhizobium leguminosarum bv. trifolii WSM1325]MBY2996634.1 LysR family transcriptional regulator [Rhizobium leguminosarum]MBY3042981.1 LysR family transcriptional regulator [Rhizobium leguminosarum]MBY3056591.1 LysR family transcriptional regulator [Rhizobium leguminosarum]RWY63562.1 LysR family transcriptional regulator [Rhizobium leguminosarum]
MRPSLESLRVLEACVSAGSFARAAERLFLTPAAVSLRIRTLEAELGQPLFIRAGRRVVPTAAASVLAKRVREALTGIGEALAEFQAATPPLRLTAPPTFASRWLAPRLARYPTPGASVIEVDVSAEIRDPGAFDVAIRTGRGGWAGLEEYRLAPVEVTPMLSPSLLETRTLAAPEALADFELLPHPDWEQWFKEAQCSAPQDLRFLAVDYPTHELDANAALAGVGVALLSPSLFRPLLTEGRLIAPFPYVLSGPAWHFALIRANDPRQAPRQLCAWLRAQAGEAA